VGQAVAAHVGAERDAVEALGGQGVEHLAGVAVGALVVVRDPGRDRGDNPGGHVAHPCTDLEDLLGALGVVVQLIRDPLRKRQAHVPCCTATTSTWCARWGAP
jgi:hypothetical protein